MMIIRKNLLLIALSLLAILMSAQAKAHCQIPCGIYDDYARVNLMLEDFATIEKADKMIAELAYKSDAQSQNQMIRWVINKESHAQNIIDTISDYFLTQRVKASQKDYTERLVKHHNVIVLAMKVKQNVEIKYAKDLEKSINDISSYYPEHGH